MALGKPPDEQPPTMGLPDNPSGTLGPRVPDHELIRSIGAGSYGDVWLARNVMGTYRAVKVVYRQTFSDERPYEREFHGMQKFEPVSRSHDGLVDILQVGRNDAAGYFFYIMELGDDAVSGQNIDPIAYQPKTLGTEVVRRRRLPFDECLQLGLSLSAALSHLHKHGLLHRDIKPSNIIFVNGIPKVADIGLVTGVGTSKSIVGTEGFIPPEGPGSVQADIYSLGKVLYEISTGHDRQAFPALPTQLEEISQQESILELNEVILKACESDVQKRYRTAEEMHADLLLLRAGKSVKRLRLLEKRLALLTRVGLVTGALLVLASGAYYQAYREKWKETQRLAKSYLDYAARSIKEGDLFGSLPWLAAALKLEERDARSVERHRIHLGVVLRQCPRIVRVWFEDGGINDAQFSPDARYVLTASASGRVAVWDVQNDSLAYMLEGHTNGVESATFSRDGSRILTSGADHTTRVWDVATRREIFRLMHANTVSSARFSTSGNRILTASGNDQGGSAKVWDATTGDLLFELTNHTKGVMYACFSHDDRLIATASQDETVLIWDVASRKPIRRLLHPPLASYENWVYYVGFSPDGRQVITASFDKAARLWDVETGRELRLLEHDDPVRSAEFSPDGRYVLTGCWDNTARVWDVTTGKEAIPRFKHNSRVSHASFSPDGSQIVTGNMHGVVCLWTVAPRTSQMPSVPAFFSLDGNRYVTVNSNVLQVYTAGRSNFLSSTILTRSPVRDVKLDRSGTRIVTFSMEKLPTGVETQFARLWNALTAKPLSVPFPFTNSVQNASLSPNGRYLATFDSSNVEVWDATTGERLSRAFTHGANVAAISFSPDSKKLAAASGTNACIWSLSTKTRLAVLPHAAEVSDIEFSPDGSYVVSACMDPSTAVERYAQLWDARTGRPIGSPMKHGDGVRRASFSPDGKRIVTAGEDRWAQVWTVAGSRLIAPQLEHKDQVNDAAFSPNGRWVLTACADDTARVWDAATGAPITPPLKHPWPLRHVRFLAEGRAILAKRLKGDTWMWWRGGHPSYYAWRIWDLSPDERPLEDLVLKAQFLSSQWVNEAGGALPLTREAFRATWEKLSSHYPEDFKTSENEILAWHLEEAQACEQAQQWAAASFHWTQLTRAKPEDPTLRERLAAARQKRESQLREGKSEDSKP